MAYPYTLYMKINTTSAFLIQTRSPLLGHLVDCNFSRRNATKSNGIAIVSTCTEDPRTVHGSTRWNPSGLWWLVEKFQHCHVHWILVCLTLLRHPRQINLILTWLLLAIAWWFSCHFGFAFAAGKRYCCGVVVAILNDGFCCRFSIINAQRYILAPVSGCSNTLCRSFTWCVDGRVAMPDCAERTKPAVSWMKLLCHISAMTAWLTDWVDEGITEWVIASIKPPGGQLHISRNGNRTFQLFVVSNPSVVGGGGWRKNCHQSEFACRSCLQQIIKVRLQHDIQQPFILHANMSSSIHLTFYYCSGLLEHWVWRPARLCAP